MPKLEIPREDSWYCIKIALSYLVIGYVVLKLGILIWLVVTQAWDTLPELPFDFWGAIGVYWIYKFGIFILENLIICWLLIYVATHLYKRNFFSNQFSKEFPYIIVGFIVIIFKVFQISIPTLISVFGLSEMGFISWLTWFTTTSPGLTFITLAYYYIVMYFVWDYFWENLFEFRLPRGNDDQPFGDLFGD